MTLLYESRKVRVAVELNAQQGERLMEYLYIVKWLEGAIPPAAFLAVLWVLWEPKVSHKAARWAAVGFLAAEAAVQVTMAMRGQSPELVFTLLPLTLCLPAIVLAHLLSARPFVPTAMGWLIALLCQHLLLAAQKLLLMITQKLTDLPSFDGRPSGGDFWEGVFAAVLLLAAVGLVAVLVRWFRKPFQTIAGKVDGGWAPLLFLPVMLLAAHSYFLSSVTAPAGLLLLLVTALAAFWTLARLMSALAAERKAEESRIQMEALRRDYALLQKKLELGRSCRHDTRHHMLALSALLQQGDTKTALEYISDWQGQLTQVESRNWCENAAVNAVLSAYLSQAEETGCLVEAEVTLPGKLSVEELDLCVTLANALENALHACQAMPEGNPRNIKLELTMTDHRRLTLHVENSCAQAVEIGDDGFPVGEWKEGHGQGLKSIAAVAEKYNGVFQCDCANGTFGLRVVLLDAAAEPRHTRRVPTVCAGAFLILFLLNCMPALAQALEVVPVLGNVVRIVDLRSYSWFWGDTGISVQEPVLDGDGQAAEQVEAEKEEFISRMKEVFVQCAARKYQGYAGEDVGYEVMRDDEALFILRFDATINVGGSVDYHRHIVLDKQTGRVLKLADLFLEDVNYVFPISREVKAQMEGQMNAGEGNYYLPGGIWAEEECFQSIDPEEQDFYINADGQLVVAFGEYEVAPGFMGSPEFTIPTDLLDGLLVQPSLLK